MFTKWLKGNYIGESFGNGCAMRISPIANYYDEISFNSNGIIIYTDNKKALYKEITDALKSIESK